MYEDRANRIKDHLREIFSKYGFHHTNFSSITNLNHDTVSLWMQGLVPSIGNGVNIADQVQNFIEQFEASKPKMPTTSLQKLPYLKQPNNLLETAPESIDSNHGFGSLVPITIDTEIDGRHYKERFCFDKNQPYLTPEIFAKMITKQLNMPEQFEKQIINEVQRQIDSFKLFQPVRGELIRIIKLNVRLDGYVLRDQFEWDVNNPSNSPEQFAGCLCTDLGLGSQFVPPVAHSIREQVYQHQRKAMSEKRQYGDPYHEPRSMIRDPLQFPETDLYLGNPKDVHWGPIVQELSESELKRIENQERRQARLEKRRRNQ